MFVLREAVKPNTKAGLEVYKGIFAAVPASSHIIIYEQLFFLSEVISKVCHRIEVTRHITSCFTFNL